MVTRDSGPLWGVEAANDGVFPPPTEWSDMVLMVRLLTTDAVEVDAWWTRLMRGGPDSPHESFIGLQDAGVIKPARAGLRLALRRFVRSLWRNDAGLVVYHRFDVEYYEEFVR